MKITVLKILEQYEEEFIISFFSEQGAAVARWNGDVPILNGVYFVEVEIPDVLNWGTDVIKAVATQFSIKNEDGFTILVGKLESSYDDGCYDIRFGHSIVTLELKGEPYPLETYLQIRTKNIILYDIGF